MNRTSANGTRRRPAHDHGTVAEVLVFAVAILFGVAAAVVGLNRNVIDPRTDRFGGVSNSTTAPTVVSSFGTLTGRVTAAPTCPVERLDHPCPPAPVVATVQAKSREGRVIRSTRTDATGGYSMRVPVGEYRMIAQATKPSARCEAMNAKVVADHTTRASISCDTGIR